MNNLMRYEDCDKYMECLNNAAYQDENLSCESCLNYQPVDFEKQLKQEHLHNNKRVQK